MTDQILKTYPLCWNYSLNFNIPGSAAYNLISSYSNEIVIEVGPPIVRAVVQKIVENVERFFDKVPAEELEVLY